MKFTLTSKAGPLVWAISDPVMDVDGAVCSVTLNDRVLAPRIVGLDPFNAAEAALSFIRAYLSAREDALMWSDGSRYESPGHQT